MTTNDDDQRRLDALVLYGMVARPVPQSEVYGAVIYSQHLPTAAAAAIEDTIQRQIIF